MADILGSYLSANKPKSIFEVLSDAARMRQEWAKGAHAEEAQQQNAEKLKGLIAAQLLQNQVTGLKMPFVVPHERANLRNTLAQAAERETETRYIPEKYKIQKMNADIALKNYLLNRERFSPESIDVLNKYRKSLTEKSEQLLGNVETDAYGNPVSREGQEIPSQEKIQNADQLLSSGIKKEDREKMMSNVALSQGFPPLNDKEAIRQWINSSHPTPEKIQQFRSLLAKSKEEPLRIPPPDETFKKSATTRMIGGQPSERIGSKGGRLKLIPTGSYNKMLEQYHAIQQVKPELDLLLQLGKRLYSGIPLTPDENDMYKSQLALVKDTFVGATHLPKLRQTFNTIHEILARKKFTTSKEYVTKLTHLQNKLNHDFQQLQYPMSTGYEYFPGKK